MPLDLSDDTNNTCNISKSSPSAKLFRNCDFIVWHECTMSYKGGMYAVDWLLKDIRNSDETMGGVTLLFSGDFRQILPVCPRGTKADELTHV